jgi:hypothetical protein
MPKLSDFKVAAKIGIQVERQNEKTQAIRFKQFF